jgi:threonine/homoserine/homoserine lactone efflux protein
MCTIHFLHERNFAAAPKEQQLFIIGEVATLSNIQTLSIVLSFFYTKVCPSAKSLPTYCIVYKLFFIMNIAEILLI